MTRYPLVPLSEILDPHGDEVPVNPLQSYEMAGVLSFGRGLFRKESINGSLTSYKKYFRLHEGQFVYSRLFAWEGAVAVVPPSFDGTFMSQEFPTFSIRRERALPEYLALVCRWPSFHDNLARLTKGLGLRRQRVHPEQLLSVSVPLPEINEQRRVATKLRSLSDRVRKVQQLRTRTESWLQAMLPSAVEATFQPGKGWIQTSVHELCETPQYGYTAAAVWEPVGPKFVRITDISRGSIQWDDVPFCECPNPDSYFVAAGDLLVARTGRPGSTFLFRQGPEAVFASYLIRLRVRQGVSPDYLYWYFQSPSYWAQIRAGSRGTAHMNVNGKRLQQITVPLAPEAERERIVNYLQGVSGRVRQLRARTASAQTLGGRLSIALLDRAFVGEL